MNLEPVSQLDSSFKFIILPVREKKNNQANMSIFQASKSAFKGYLETVLFYWRAINI